MDNTIKNDNSIGKARGHSMLSPLKVVHQEQGVGEGAPPGLPGISFERLQDGPRIDKVAINALVDRPSYVATTRRTVSESRISALTMALQAADAGAKRSLPSIVVTPFVLAPGDVTPHNSPTGSGIGAEQHSPIESANDCSQPDLRKWCSGHPPKKSFISSDRNFPLRLRMCRRNTLADKPELDLLLAATKVDYNGHSYLPLTTHTIHHLDPFFKGAKPLADMKLFDCIVITHEVNSVHADHVVAALECIGEHCKHLLVMSPVRTSELGNVFTREAGLISPGNDWDAILGCFPNLEYLAFVHHADEPIGFSRNTFRGLQMAVANRQGTSEELKDFTFSVPTALLSECLQHKS